MAYTSHGYHIQGTSDRNPPSSKIRCDGPAYCAQCSKESAAVQMTGSTLALADYESEILPGDREANYQTKAMEIVRSYVNAENPSVEFDIYVVWFSKTLQNWKALVATTRADGMYYEVTYDGNKKQTYLDAYMKVHNRVIKD